MHETCLLNRASHVALHIVQLYSPVVDGGFPLVEDLEFMGEVCFGDSSR